MGLSTLAITVGEQTETVEDVYEPFLIQRGLLQRTPRGRIATAAAYAHLGVDIPAAAEFAAGDDGATGSISLFDSAEAAAPVERAQRSAADPQIAHSSAESAAVPPADRPVETDAEPACGLSGADRRRGVVSLFAGLPSLRCTGSASAVAGR